MNPASSAPQGPNRGSLPEGCHTNLVPTNDATWSTKPSAGGVLSPSRDSEVALGIHDQTQSLSNVNTTALFTTVNSNSLQAPVLCVNFDIRYSSVGSGIPTVPPPSASPGQPLDIPSPARSTHAPVSPCSDMNMDVHVQSPVGITVVTYPPAGDGNAWPPTDKDMSIERQFDTGIRNVGLRSLTGGTGLGEHSRDSDVAVAARHVHSLAHVADEQTTGPLPLPLISTFELAPQKPTQRLSPSQRTEIIILDDDTEGVVSSLRSPDLLPARMTSGMCKGLTSEEKKANRCVICFRFFTDKKELQYHVKAHAGDTKSFDCGVCGKTFPIDSLLQTHLRSHAGEAPFKCLLCDTAFKVKTSLMAHMEVHKTGKKPFKCSICEKRFISRGSMSTHMASIHGPPRYQVFECDLCDKKFCSKGSLQKHLAIHSSASLSNQVFECHLCDNKFTDKKKLQHHVKAHAGDIKSFNCGVCSKTFPIDSLLQTHLRVHTGEVHFKCALCDKAFKKNSTLMAHMEIHKTGKKPFQCSICEKRFISIASVRTHRSVIHGPLRNQGFDCDLCDRKFCSKGSLQKHLAIHPRASQSSTRDPRNNHSMSQPPTGAVAARPVQPTAHVADEEAPGPLPPPSKSTFELAAKKPTQRVSPSQRTEIVILDDDTEHDVSSSRSPDLLPSRMTSSGMCKGLTPEEKKANRCVICFRFFANKKKLQHHVKAHAGDLKSFDCGVCGKTFPIDSLLQTHLRSHTREAPFKCLLCDRVFKAKLSLMAHMEVHKTGKKPFKCSICEKRFISIGSIRTHRSVIHGPTRNHVFECHLCDKLFSSKGSLRNHLAIHSRASLSNQVFECHLCDNKFSTKGSLKRHVTIHERSKKQFPCTICGKEFSTEGKLKAHVEWHSALKP